MSSPAPAAVQDHAPPPAAGPTSPAGTEDQHTRPEVEPPPAAEDQSESALQQALEAVSERGVKLQRHHKKAIGAALVELAQTATRTARCREERERIRQERERKLWVDERRAREDRGEVPKGGRLAQARRWLVRERLLATTIAVTGACGLVAFIGQISFYLSFDKLPVAVAWLIPIALELMSWTYGGFAAKAVEEELLHAKYTRRMWGFAFLMAALNTYHGWINIGEWSIGLFLGLPSICGPALWHTYTGYKRGLRSGRTYDELRVAAKQRLLSPLVSWRADRIEVILGEGRKKAWRLALSMTVRDVRALVREAVRRELEQVDAPLVAVLRWGAKRRRAKATAAPARPGSSESVAGNDGERRRKGWRRRSKQEAPAGPDGSEVIKVDLANGAPDAEPRDTRRDIDRDTDRDIERATDRDTDRATVSLVPMALPWSPGQHGRATPVVTSHADSASSADGRDGAVGVTDVSRIGTVELALDRAGVGLEKMWAELAPELVTPDGDLPKSGVAETGTGRRDVSRNGRHGDRDAVDVRDGRRGAHRDSGRDRSRDGVRDNVGGRAGARDSGRATRRGRDTGQHARPVTPGGTVTSTGSDTRERDTRWGQQRRLIEDRLTGLETSIEGLYEMGPKDVTRLVFPAADDAEVERKRPHVSRILSARRQEQSAKKE